MNFLKATLFSVVAISLGGCIPQLIVGKKPDGGDISAAFYPGGTELDDLIIIDGQNHFGKASYSFNDNLGDVSFRFNSGERVRAECTAEGKDLIGDTTCAMYEVFRSDFALIPEGTLIPNPTL